MTPDGRNGTTEIPPPQKIARKEKTKATKTWEYWLLTPSSNRRRKKKK